MFDFEEDIELLADENAFAISSANTCCSSNEVDCSPPLCEFEEELDNICKFLAMNKGLADIIIII